MKKVGYFFFCLCSIPCGSGNSNRCSMFYDRLVRHNGITCRTQPVSIPEYKRQTKHPLAYD